MQCLITGLTRLGALCLVFVLCSERTAIQVASMHHEIKGHAVAMDRAVPRKDSDDPGAMSGGGVPGAGPAGAGYGMMDGYNAPSPMGLMQVRALWSSPRLHISVPS